MAVAVQLLGPNERSTLERALDHLLPPDGSFPAPSECGVIDQFILPQLTNFAEVDAPYPGITLDDLRDLLHQFATNEAMDTALGELERSDPVRFQALWALAVYGYYSRPEVTAAIQRELAPAYHGAPLPLGYAHVIEPWKAEDPLQLPRNPIGSYIPTNQVRNVDTQNADRKRR